MNTRIVALKFVAVIAASSAALAGGMTATNAGNPYRDNCHDGPQYFPPVVPAKMCGPASAVAGQKVSWVAHRLASGPPATHTLDFTASKPSSPDRIPLAKLTVEVNGKRTQAKCVTSGRYGPSCTVQLSLAKRDRVRITTAIPQEAAGQRINLAVSAYVGDDIVAGAAIPVRVRAGNSSASVASEPNGFVTGTPGYVAPRVKGVSDGFPGSRTTYRDSRADWRCSAGFYARRGAQTYMVTAGHCGQGIAVLSDNEGDPYGTTLDVFFEPDGKGSDLAGPGDHMAVASSGFRTSIQHTSGLIPIAGLAPASMLKPGQRVCKIGNSTKLNCNIVLADLAVINRDLEAQGRSQIPTVAANKWLFGRAMAPSTSMPNAAGDSGGVVYVVRKGKAFIAGITSWGWDCVRHCDEDSRQSKEFDVLGFTKASVAVKDLDVVVLRD